MESERNLLTTTEAARYLVLKPSDLCKLIALTEALLCCVLAAIAYTYY